MREAKPKIWLLSNVKAVLILVVVFGHFIPYMTDLGNWNYDLRVAIWMFHMPAFMFVSGFLSKDLEKCRLQAVRTKLIPYLLLVVIIRIGRTLFLGSSFKLLFIRPAHTTWYFLVLFWYAFFTPELLKLKKSFPVIVTLSLAAGCMEYCGADFAAGKFFGFLPFYVAGLSCSREALQRVKKLPAVLTLPALLGAAAIAVWLSFRDADVVEMLSMRDPYEMMDVTMAQGILYRGAGYLGAALMIFVLLRLIPDRKLPVSFVGDNTLTVYSFHMVLIYAAAYFGWILQGNGLLQFLQVAVMSVAMTLVLAAPVLSRGYAAFINGIYRLITKKEAR